MTHLNHPTPNSAGQLHVCGACVEDILLLLNTASDNLHKCRSGFRKCRAERDALAKRVQFLEDRLEQGGRTVPKPVRNERACTCPWLEARGTMLHAMGCPALVCPTCKGTTRVQIPCPDDKPGCLVYHTALCPDCKGWASR